MRDRDTTLIGSVLCGKVSLGRISRHTSYLTAAETIFGWTVEGADLNTVSYGPSEAFYAMFIALPDHSKNNLGDEMEQPDLFAYKPLASRKWEESLRLDAEATKQERGTCKQEVLQKVPHLIQERGLEVNQDKYQLTEQ